ncbi:MAG: hypothetical protein LBR10_02100 [Prevotellaceae bacterium]|nr:hypothetical protein [Prevotellaceae bacterium]
MNADTISEIKRKKQLADFAEPQRENPQDNPEYLTHCLNQDFQSCHTDTNTHAVIASPLSESGLASPFSFLLSIVKQVCLCAHSLRRLPHSASLRSQ